MAKIIGQSFNRLDDHSLTMIHEGTQESIASDKLDFCFSKEPMEKLVTETPELSAIYPYDDDFTQDD